MWLLPIYRSVVSDRKVALSAEQEPIPRPSYQGARWLRIISSPLYWGRDVPLLYLLKPQITQYGKITKVTKTEEFLQKLTKRCRTPS
jgi:hypothetical protein